MKVGDRVMHPRLNFGTILEFRKYGGVMVDFSDKSGVLVRIVKLEDLEEVKK